MSNAPTTRASAAVNAVARETLRRIAQERIAPTPETYSRIYREIARTHPDHPAPGDDNAAMGQARTSASLIARLLTQVEAHHAGITVTRKREGLKRALIPRLEPIDALFARLERLMDSWNGPNAETGTNVSQFLGTDMFGANHDIDPAASAHAHAPSASLFMQADPVATMPSPAMRPIVSGPHSDLPEKTISFRLAGLLAMLLKNIEELTPESGLLANQIEQIGRVLTAPLTEKKLDEAERCLRALIVRQGAIKHSLDETKRAVRDLAETLLGRLSTLVSSTDSHSTRMVDIAERIAGTNDLGQLSTLTQMLVSDARLMSESVATERGLLVEAESRARALQERTATLENELREASTLVRTDPLTRAMNRRGFGDAFRAEMANAAGLPQPTVALLDVDNFKRINESYGHSIGDEVLCSLVEVLHRCALPVNTVARYGGEEFALMFPGLGTDEAERAVLKMQRALLDHQATVTPHQPAITFSAGIARVESGDALAQVITRADRALRQAKQAGKNCIVVAVREVASA